MNDRNSPLKMTLIHHNSPTQKKVTASWSVQWTSPLGEVASRLSRSLLRAHDAWS